MDAIYNKIVNLLSGILEPVPLNQLGMPQYCRYMLNILADVKSAIEDLETSYRSTLRLYEMDIDEEF